MKAAIYIDRKGGDDGKTNRLLSSFQEQLPYKIKELIPIRGDVFKIITSNGIYILKGYTSYSRLKLQETFTSSLKNEGFQRTYSFIMNQEPIVYQDKFYGCLEFIDTHQRSFSYGNEKERQEGLVLLDEYHRTTIHSVQRYKSILPEFDLQKKWTERRNQFVKKINIVSKFIPEEIIMEWIDWADWALDGLERHSYIIETEPAVILHGDVAHHNFLRGKNEKLYLIDFDLISIGPSSMDLLQFANRILPFISWDLNELSNYQHLNRLLTTKSYLYALVYPTDLFREWNRIIRNHSFQNHLILQQVLNQTYYKMSLRRQCMNELKNLVE